MNLLRSFTKGGFADLSRVHQWNQEFVAASPAGKRYEELAAGIDRALRFMEACGISTETQPALHAVDFYTSHEALILGYEEPLTRLDSLTGEWYDCSAHMLWIGERTRQLDGAHMAFLAGRATIPVGCKIGPTVTPDEAVAHLRAAQPRPRAGPTHAHHPDGSRARRRSPSPSARGGPRLRATPSCGSATPCTATPTPPRTGPRPATSTRSCDEIGGFFRAHHAAGTWPGGVHCELTGADVTECLGGAQDLVDADLGTRYETVCDPRLNARQSLDLAFRVAELLHHR